MAFKPAPGHAHLDADEGAHPPRVVDDVARQRHIGPVLEETPDDLRAAGPLRSDVHFPRFAENRSAEPVRREVGVHVQPAETFDIGLGDREQMTQRDLNPQGTPQRRLGLLDRIEDIPRRPVARRMQVQIDAVTVQLAHELAQPLRREQYPAAVVGVRGIRLQHGGGQDVLQSVVVDLDGVEPKLAVGVPVSQLVQGVRRRLDMLRRPDVVRPFPAQREIAFLRDLVRGLVH